MLLSSAPSSSPTAVPLLSLSLSTSNGGRAVRLPDELSCNAACMCFSVYVWLWCVVMYTYALVCMRMVFYGQTPLNGIHQHIAYINTPNTSTHCIHQHTPPLHTLSVVTSSCASCNSYRVTDNSSSRAFARFCKLIAVFVCGSGCGCVGVCGCMGGV